MLFLFDLPIDTEGEKPEQMIGKQTAEHNGGMLRLKDKKKFIAVFGGVAGLVVMIGILVVISANLRTPKNVSPYCMLMKTEGKVCKIHNKVHEGKKLNDLVISEEEMAFHQQLFDEVSKGAYFDGERLYRQEDAEEILAIKEAFAKEKESLFERYLSSNLQDDEKTRYNFVIQELAAIDYTIRKYRIIEADKSLPSKEELFKEVESLKKELDTLRMQNLVDISPIEEVSTETGEVLLNKKTVTDLKQDQLLYISQPSKAVIIPKDIENAATIKKSSVYN